MRISGWVNIYYRSTIGNVPIVHRKAKNNETVTKCYRNIKFIVNNPCVSGCNVLICIRINLNITEILRNRKKMLRG